jgi:putative transposase
VSLREVELMMAYRGIQLSYETIRRWCDTFGASYAAKLKRKRPKLGDKWFLDEVFLKINGVQHYLWRAVDQQGTVIDILVQPKRDRFAAIRFFRKLLRTTGRPPRVIITDKLRSYGAVALQFNRIFRAHSVQALTKGVLFSAEYENEGAPMARVTWEATSD